jgi:copper chaperone CopZ
MNNEIYIYDIPGRLRVRTQAIKKHACAAQAVQELFQAVPGVLSTMANPLTGSITVTYDANGLNSAVIMDTLRKQGYLDAQRKKCDRPATPAQRSLTRTLVMDIAVPKLGKMILGWTVERALAAAVAALL